MRFSITKEKKKYDELYKNEPKYGGKTGRVKAFKKDHDKLHINIKDAISRANSILDVGCGRGPFIDLFKTMNKRAEIIGLDISKECAKSRPDLKIDVGSMHKMPYKKGQFDVVVHMDGMEHIPEQIEEKALSELLRVAKSHIYMTIAIHEVKRDKGREVIDKVHCNLKTVKQWKNIFIELVRKNNINDWIFKADKNWIYIYLRK